MDIPAKGTTQPQRISYSSHLVTQTPQHKLLRAAFQSYVWGNGITNHLIINSILHEKKQKVPCRGSDILPG